MFDQFSESAKLVIFGARVEAGGSGSSSIKAEHIFRALLAEDQGEWLRAMAEHFGGRPISAGLRTPTKFFNASRAAKLKEALSYPPEGPPIPNNIDMPLGDSAKRAIETAIEHAAGKTVGVLHLLWGLLDDEQSRISELLRENGVTAEDIDRAIEDSQQTPPQYPQS